MRKAKYFFIGFFSLAIVITALAFTVSFVNFDLCRKSISELGDYQHEELLRIKIYGSSETEDGNTISGIFAIVDSKGSEIALIERSWSGSYLAVDFTQINMNEKQLYFPVKIYGKESLIQNFHGRKTGTTLDKYYNENGICVLAGSGASKKEKKALYRISRFALQKNLIFGFKHKKTLTVDLSGCINGKYYSIVRVNSGNLILKSL